jgi:hypothetical protein
VLAIVVVVLGVCLGSTQAPTTTGERTTATITRAVVHAAPASVHFDGTLPIVAAAILSVAWAIERAARLRTLVPVTSTQIRRRGPPSSEY